MPRRYTAKRKVMRKAKAKRRYRAKRRNYSSAKRVVANFGQNIVFPRQYRCKLKYSDVIQIDSGLLSRDRVFGMNNLFDPDFTGSGTQPRYFDQLSILYAQYRVLGCKVRARYMPNDATTPGQTHYMGVLFSNDSTSLNSTEYNNFAEKPFAKTVINNIYGRRSDIKHYASIAKIAGVNSAVVKNDDTYASLVNASPTRPTYVHVVCGTLNQASTAINGQLVIDITYYAQFERPIVPARS